jgi:hypothetical protein
MFKDIVFVAQKGVLVEWVHHLLVQDRVGGVGDR